MEVDYSVISGYQLLYPQITTSKLFKIIERIQSSKKFELDEVFGSFVLLKGTRTPIGYLGNDNQIELVELKENNPNYRLPKQHFSKLIRACA